MANNDRGTVEELWRALDEQFNAMVGEMQQMNLSNFPGKLRDSVEEYTQLFWDQLTQNGTLPSPSLPSLFTPKQAPPPVKIIPPTMKQRLVRSIQRQPYLYGSAAALLPVFGYFYARRYMPNFHRAYLTIPGWQNLSVQRPIVNTLNGQDTRMEAVLVLGADPGTLAREIALDLVERGFVVIASVSEQQYIAPLENAGRRFLKAIALDPTDLTSLPQFLQTLSITLSLRFPLNSAGDPFASAHQRSLSLSAVLNCLAIISHCALEQNTDVWPLEATSLGTFTRTLTGTVACTLGVLQGVMPLLRQKSGNSTVAATSAKIITLLPCTTSQIALPFVGAQSAADAALLHLMDALRRESACANSGKPAQSRPIKYVAVDVGFFGQSQTSTHQPYQTESEELPRHLSFYAPALARRCMVSIERGGPVVTSNRKAAPVHLLSQKIYKIIIGKHNKHRTGIGSGSFTYYIASLLPSYLIDSYLSAQDYVASALQRPTRMSNRPRPLPRPPTTQQSSHSRSTLSPTTDTSLPGSSQSSQSGSNHAGYRADEEEDMSSSIASIASASSGNVFGASAVFVDRSDDEQGNKTVTE